MTADPAPPVPLMVVRIGPGVPLLPPESCVLATSIPSRELQPMLPAPTLSAPKTNVQGFFGLAHRLFPAVYPGVQSVDGVLSFSQRVPPHVCKGVARKQMHARPPVYSMPGVWLVSDFMMTGIVPSFCLPTMSCRDTPGTAIATVRP